MISAWRIGLDNNTEIEVTNYKQSSVFLEFYGL